MYVYISQRNIEIVCVCVCSHGQFTSKRVEENCRDFPKKYSSRDRTAPAAPPAPTRAAPVSTGAAQTKKLNAGDFTPWDLAQIWIESVAKEETGRKQWEEMHGWMAEYDPKVTFISFHQSILLNYLQGNLKPRKRTLENATRFSNTVREENPFLRFIHSFPLGSEFSWS